MWKPGLRRAPGGGVSPRGGLRPRMPLWVVLGAWGAGLALSPVPRAVAEAPYFYDSVGDHVQYDPEFYPLNWSPGMLALSAQAWSRSDPPGTPRQAWSNQENTGQYRLQWWASPDPAYSLLVELKGDTEGNAVGEDYFLRSEFYYHGLQTALFLYVGIRVPDKGDFTVYGGVESLSYRLSDIFTGMKQDIPVAFRGFGEIRYVMDAEDPYLRFQAMAHTLPEWGVRSLVLSAAMSLVIQDEASPEYELQGHAEWYFYESFVRAGATFGYGLDLDSDGEQRFAAGLRLELF